MSPTDDTPLQPLLDDALIVLRAPTQVWSAHDGELGAQPIDGVYHGDVRHVRSLRLSCRDSDVEWISTAAHGPSRAVFGGLLRGLDDATPDPKVRLLRERAVTDVLLLVEARREDGDELAALSHPQRGARLRPARCGPRRRCLRRRARAAPAGARGGRP